ncbi:lipase family protein [Nannocystis radixulma]|uniref:Lipase family protein n=1 Tax=Nannocystis radixulma TaxID=2995305 RepID=A0ABT5BGQ3_9BACT|nr:lipase family protein [Nannocystis radixulma]MDC0672888.1 lipase family protein [Nannocystis radixulma]
MHLEHAFTKCPGTKKGDPGEHLVDGVVEGQYDHCVAELLSVASAWSYTHVETYTDRLCQMGLDGETVAIRVRNDAILVDATAYLFQSADKKLGILTVRGTAQDDIIRWLTDVRATMMPFPSVGMVHGGLYRSGMALWPTLREFLAALYTGKPLGKRLVELSPKKPGKRPESEVDAVGKKKKPILEALYITGHSTGGSLAGMATAGIYMDPQLEPMRKLVRGVYAYGPAMFADPTLARTLHKQFGDKTYRFMYENDFVTKMPPRTVGRYMHFGHQLVSSSRDGVWVEELRLDRQLRTTLTANMVGAIARAKDAVYLSMSLPIAYNWGDHSPANYMRISRNAYVGLGNP